MPGRAACLFAIVLSACVPATQEVTVGVETVGVDPAAATGWNVEDDLAQDARAFFFAQADLYLAGASTSEGGPLADMLRAMGRDDLVYPSPEHEPRIACPQRWVDPVELVSRASAGARAVIIESEKHAPEQIAFVQRVASRLAGDGFDTYADDGLSFGPGGTSDTSAPLVTEGSVARDPGYGRLLRDMKTHGMELIDPGIWWTSPRELAALPAEEQRARRHLALAQQVNRRVLSRSPTARAIIHAERGDEAKVLEKELRRLSGFEPVVVSFVRCSETLEAPAFLPDSGEGEWPANGADIVIAIPRPPMVSGRQGSAKDSGEAPVAVPAVFAPQDLPVLVEARRAGDPVLAVPEDRLLLMPGERLPLLLMPGSYRIEAWTKNGPISEPVSQLVD
ncbi:MAG TPA: hypothetical protein DCY26_03505 [Hyphomonas sp.]|nr:hypothetical protein [Hyphomonas sp.]